jgi:branched-chain amino acid aminotransferase
MDIRIERTTQLSAKPEDSILGFGKYFTDHAFLCNWSEEKGWFDARIAPRAPVPLDLGACVLHYGQALFEGMKAFHGVDGKDRLLHLPFLANRMRSGAQRLCLPQPPDEVFMGGVKALLDVERDWIPRTRGCSLYIRPTLIGTESFLGIRPASEALFFIILSPVGSYYAKGLAPVRIWVEEQMVRAAPGGLGATKSGANYAASMSAGYEAKKKGYDQVLWLDAIEHEWVEEVGTMNVFFQIGDEVVTPALNGTILGGSTRKAVLEILRHWGINAVERRISMTEIVQARNEGRLVEAFGTGTAAVISPIGELAWKGENLMVGDGETGPLAQRLQAAIQAIQYGESPDELGWSTLV